ncbi:MAG: DUF539 domain-containing protein [Deltaproteobacteria bacterium]|jgi:hypothetical protein|nr:DUF539 domain-containing protein [Deltaproteobacteria bacterium]
MTVVLLTVGFFAIAMGAMALGVILSNRRLHGSCGGAGGDDCLCEIEKRRACHHQKHGLGADGVISTGADRAGLFGAPAADGRA